MTYNAYKIFNLSEFEDTGLTSRKVTAFLSGLGQREVLITKGNLISVLFDGVFLSLDLNDANPFEFEDRAVFLDPDGEVWVGVKVED
jgi:hypothetical protein